MAGGNKLRNKDLVAAKLAAGQTVASAATACGVSERSVYGWLSDDGFKARVRELQAEMITLTSFPRSVY